MSALNAHDILRRPRLTEKSTRIREAAARHKHSGEVFLFEVDPRANKIQIAAAVEEVFGVDVLHVRTVNVKGKTRRYGRSVGEKPNRKKAYITLKPGSKTIDFLEG